ncbi:two-component system response regulator PmrA [Raoultella sp. WB_B2P2-3]|jgi:two-component system response regulator BasR|uniref:Two-component system response regulator PmrA n=1 Tax=Raoultella scottii TaxID=3040937 RepID=A0ABU8ZCY5_9ENTR|nr:MULTISPECIES: two-component system response regulator PmrA [Enterobacteriaceae]MVT01634.1 two-component system response regulator PmrA [Raoultella sp. 10-1]PAC14169.1 two-component system response regulator BasR [Enterobacter sp. 10-1]
MKILVIEDDALLLQGLILAMQSEGYACDGVSSAHEAALSLASNHYSLVVLDLGLPDEDGLHFLARMRREKFSQPVLILTARDTVEDRIDGLDTGADDYLVKPFALEELNARIRALLRRHNNQGDSEMVVGNLRLNITRRQVWLGGDSLELTPKEYSLLSRLMMKAGSPVHREILYNDIYSWDNEPATNTLEVHIHNLRDKVGKARIRTVRGFGYMLVNNTESES